MYICLHIKYPSFLLDINETWIFLTDLKKNIQTSNFMEIRFVGAKLSDADRKMDMMRLTVAFCNFVNTPKKCIHQTVIIDAQNHWQILMVSDVPDASWAYRVQVACPLVAPPAPRMRLLNSLSQSVSVPCGCVQWFFEHLHPLQFQPSVYPLGALYDIVLHTLQTLLSSGHLDQNQTIT